MMIFKEVRLLYIINKYYSYKYILKSVFYYELVNIAIVDCVTNKLYLSVTSSNLSINDVAVTMQV